jgi:FkbM family methyltransferase
MLINFTKLKKKYDMNIKGIIHVGAHYGEEFREYLENHVQIIHAFEPVMSNLKVLRKNIKKLKARIKIYPFALGSKKINKKVIFLSDNNELQSSSFLKPKLHLIQHPNISFKKKEIVKVNKLDNLNIKDSNYISIDVQGFELEVLKGSKKTLNRIDYIYCEVNTAETYSKNPLMIDIDKYLKKYNFKRVEIFFPTYKKYFFFKKRYSWGDALYIKY